MGINSLFNKINKIKTPISSPLSALTSAYQLYDSVDVQAMMYKYGGQFSRSNQYKFTLTLPEFLRTKANGDYSDAFYIFTKSVSVPSNQLSNKVVRLGSSRLATPGVIDTDIFTLTMQDTESNFFHSLFNIWQVARTPKSGVISIYPDDFKGQGSLFRGSNSAIKDIANHIYNKNNALMTEIYNMEDIYPVSVGDLRFDDDDENSFQVFDVSFYTNRLKHFEKEL